MNNNIENLNENDNMDDDNNMDNIMIEVDECYPDGCKYIG